MAITTFNSKQGSTGQQLEKLISEFNYYVPKNASEYRYISKPFNISVRDLLADITSILQLQKQLINIQNEEMPHNDSKKQLLSAFWKKDKQQRETSEAVKVILFATTCAMLIYSI